MRVEPGGRLPLSPAACLLVLTLPRPPGAGAHDDEPTCGWNLVAGERLADSQGFCCTCSLDDTWDDTFGSNTDGMRANLDCDINWPWEGQPSSAHCLLMDTRWYVAGERRGRDTWRAGGGDVTRTMRGAGNQGQQSVQYCRGTLLHT